MTLALKYLDHLLQLDPAHLARNAAYAAHALFRAGHSGWFGDLDLVLFELASVHLPDLDSWSPQTLRDLENRIRDAFIHELESRIINIPRLYLLHNRVEPQEDPSKRPRVVHLTLRHYLTQVSVPAHRRTLTKLILGEHNYRSVTEHAPSHDAKLCRMCGVEIETPHHVLLRCTAHRETVMLREAFLHTAATSFHLRLPVNLTDGYAALWLQKLIFHWQLVPYTAQYVHRIYLWWEGKVLLPSGNGDQGTTVISPSSQPDGQPVLIHDEEEGWEEGSDIEMEQ
jgi:hypothetical protein